LASWATATRSGELEFFLRNRKLVGYANHRNNIDTMKGSLGSLILYKVESRLAKTL
jgi:hypothetical protein